jgi:glycosyltransferase involved in cell wall biosynthesis
MRPIDAQLAGGMRAGGYLLYVGRHDPYKGLPLLLAAFARARAAGSLGDVGLVITGSLDVRYDARALVAAHGLEDAVVCTDYVTREELGALYRHARALVLPSLYEGFGLPPLDAMLHDVPVLCSNRGSLPEITGDAALVCDPEDTEAFRNALVTNRRRRYFSTYLHRTRAPPEGFVFMACHSPIDHDCLPRRARGAALKGTTRTRADHEHPASF